MYKILVTTDGSEQSMKTIDEAIRVALPMGAEVTVLSVIEDTDSMNYASSIPKDVIKQVKQDQVKYYTEAVEKAKKKLEEKGVKAKTLVSKGYPVDVICNTAEKDKFNLIILGRRRLTKIQGLILGSVSNKVVQYAKTNVMIVK